MRPSLRLVLFLLLVLLPTRAELARAPDVTPQTVELRGDAARALAEFLGLADGERRLELRQSLLTELRALPGRDAALRGADGLLPADLHARASELVTVVVTWDPDVERLTIVGTMADALTAQPALDGPRWVVTSPAFRGGDDVGGWGNVLGRLGAAYSRELALGGGQAALIKRVDVGAGDGRSMLVFAFGEWGRAKGCL